MALRIIKEEGWRREHLNSLIIRFRDGAKARGLRLMESTTPIQPLVLGSAEAALSASAKLSAAGFRVTAIRPPTVPQDTARLRITLSAAHSEAQVDSLLAALESAI
jgi:8-amino-7-oxononanoate synthase